MRRLVSYAFVFIISTIILFSMNDVSEGVQELNMGSITGQILVKGKGPMPEGTAFFFLEPTGPPPSATKYWRVPTHAFRIDESGKFNAILPAGKYYMGASRKFSGFGFLRRQSLLALDTARP